MCYLSLSERPEQDCEFLHLPKGLQADIIAIRAGKYNCLEGSPKIADFALYWQCGVEFEYQAH